MKKFDKFSPSLLENPDIKISVKVPSIFVQKEETCYSIFLADASAWIKKLFAEILQIEINDCRIIEAESAKNLAGLFDTLAIRTWAINNRTPQPTAEKTKARVAKTFLYVLYKNDYDVVPILENYLQHKKEKDYISLFKNYLDEMGEKNNFNTFLTPKEKMIQTDQKFSAEVQMIEHLSALGDGKTKDQARQNACKQFLQINCIK